MRFIGKARILPLLPREGEKVFAGILVLKFSGIPLFVDREIVGELQAT